MLSKEIKALLKVSMKENTSFYLFIKNFTKKTSNNYKNISSLYILKLCNEPLITFYVSFYFRRVKVKEFQCFQ